MVRATLKSRNRLVGGSAARAKGRGKKMRRRLLGKRRRGLTQRAVKALVNRSLNRRLEVKKLFMTNSITPGITMTFYSLNDMAIGTTDSTRVGDEIFMRTLSGRMRMSMDTASPPTLIRWGIVMFKDGLTVPIAESVFEDTSNTTNLLNSPFRSRDTGTGTGTSGLYSKFKIIMDETQILSDSRPVNLNKITVKLNQKAIWERDTATSNAWMQNSLFLYIVSNQPATSPTVSWSLGLRYNDP